MVHNNIPHHSLTTSISFIWGGGGGGLLLSSSLEHPNCTKQMYKKSIYKTFNLTFNHLLHKWKFSALVTNTVFG